MKQLISICLMLLVVPQVSAEVLCDQNATTDTVSVFQNGMMQTQSHADRSSKALEELIRKTTATEDFYRTEFMYTYNNYGQMSVLYESLKKQLGQEDVVASFWNWLGGIEALPYTVQEELYSIATSFDPSTVVKPEDIANYEELYRASILCGKWVRMVSHGEGNYIANATYDILYNGAMPVPTKSFAVISVATPLGFVAGGGFYVTLVEDGVTSAISLATPLGEPNPLPPNTTNVLLGGAKADWLNHRFNLGYMVDNSRSEFEIARSIIYSSYNDVIR